MRSLCVVLALLLGSCLAQASEKESPAGKDSRKFQFTYVAELKEVPADAKVVDLWIPLPQDNKHQDISDLKIDAPGDAAVAVEPTQNNKMAHWRLDAAKAKGLKITLTFTVKRKEVALPDVSKARELTDDEKKELAPYLAANKLVLVGGPFSEVAEAAVKGAKTPEEIAKAAYDYTVKNIEYGKPKDKPGWGKGSTQWACDAKVGNCTDFHAMFMSIGRTKGIPVKFEMGFPIPERDAAKPETAGGVVGGYHCWAKFYLGGIGWVPIDASEAQKNPKLIPYYYGNLTEDRVQFTNGRDVNLVPKQAGEALNFFIYPYAEADGKSFVVEKSFAFKDVE